MSHKQLNGSHSVRPTRKVPIAIGDVLFDGKGHAYRVVSPDESDTSSAAVPAAELCVRPIEEDFSTDSLGGLTRRQRQIARLLAGRATNAEIAASLGISVHTARHHSQKVLEKLGISSRTHVRTRLGKSPRENGAAKHSHRGR